MINLLSEVVETPLSEATDAAKEMIKEVNEENCFLLSKLSDIFSLGIRENLRTTANNRAEIKAKREEIEMDEATQP